MSDCLFCKIIAGEIPAQKVYEDDSLLAILDIHPVNFGHTLVLTKQHFENTTETPDDLLGKMSVAVKRIAKAIMAGLEYEAYNLEVNTGSIAGQLIMHTHWHIVPRRGDDGLKHWSGKEYAQGQDAEVASKIKNAISL